MSNLYRTLLLWPLLLGFLGTGWAADELPSAANKLIDLHSSLTIPAWAAKTGKDTAFCRSLLSDIKAWRNVSIARPIASAASIDDPNFIRHLGTCSPESLTKIEFESRPPTTWIMRKDVNLYRLNINNVPKGNEKTVLYGKGAYHEFETAHFFVVDLEACGSEEFLSVASPNPKPILDGFAGILRHRGNHYFFDGLHFPAEGSYSVTVYRRTYLPRTKSHMFTNACSFCAPDDSEEPVLLNDRERWTRCRS